MEYDRMVGEKLEANMRKLAEENQVIKNHLSKIWKELSSMIEKKKENLKKKK